MNTQQRFEALAEAAKRARSYRGSMTWSRTNGHEYLLRSAYDRNGKRRQSSLGPRNAETEAAKSQFEAGRAETHALLEDLEAALARQASINRALRLGRMPAESARILRAVDAGGLLGGKLQVLGSNALYAYEAVGGVHFDAAYLETGDFDFLLDARARLLFVTEGVATDVSLLRLLQRVDHSFRRAAQTYRAVNRDGFMVDLVMPMRDLRVTDSTDRLGSDPDDLQAVEIEGLSWHASAPAFEAIVIDARGAPARIVTSDPRVFAAHKLWLSERSDREPVKRARDAAQATAVAALVASRMPHLPFSQTELKVLPKPVFDAAVELFAARGS